MAENALILFKNENEQKIFDIIDSELEVERKKNKIPSEERKLGAISEIGKFYKLYEFRNIWKKYRDFDDFLIRLVQDFGLYDLEENGLLIGHTDKDGHLWTDYAKFRKYKENDKE